MLNWFINSWTICLNLFWFFRVHNCSCLHVATASDFSMSIYPHPRWKKNPAKSKQQWGRWNLKFLESFASFSGLAEQHCSIVWNNSFVLSSLFSKTSTSAWQILGFSTIKKCLFCWSVQILFWLSDFCHICLLLWCTLAQLWKFWRTLC